MIHPGLAACHLPVIYQEPSIYIPENIKSNLQLCNFHTFNIVIFL